MPNTSTKAPGAGLTERGLQSRISRRTRIPRSTVCEIFQGSRRATVKQAAALEEEFVFRGIPINRWDLLYGVQRGQTLLEYLGTRKETDK